MLRLSLAVALIAAAAASSISGVAARIVSNGSELNGVTVQGGLIAIGPAAVDAVILPTGETVDLR